METTKTTAMVYCDLCQTETEHTVETDSNGELVYTCLVCGSFFKLPAGLKEDQIKQQLEKYKEVNDVEKQFVNTPPVTSQEESLKGGGPEEEATDEEA
jgi:uncharacterized Zn finger protein